jgi:hypothetical protein
MFFITLESSGANNGGNICFTLTTTPALNPPTYTTPITTNSTNLLSGVLISANAPSTTSSLTCFNHVANTNKLSTLNFSYIYTAPSAQYTSFAVWFSNGTLANTITRNIYQLSYMRIA